MKPTTLTRIVVRCVALLYVLFAVHRSYRHFDPTGQIEITDNFVSTDISSRWDEHPVASSLLSSQ